MTRRDDMIEAAYASLRARIAAGRFRPGARLSADALAQAIRIGVTPTRVALHWLSRDGLVEHAPGEGFFARTPEVADLRAAFIASRILLVGAARSATPGAVSSPDTGSGGASAVAPQSPSARTDAVFLAIAARSQSAIVVRMVDIVNARLRPARDAEAGLLANLDGEREALAGLATRGGAALAAALTRYHRRRLARIEDLAERALLQAMRPRGQ